MKINLLVTGPLDHHGLVSYIKQESLASPDLEEEVPFQAGLKRGKVFVATLTEEEEADMKKKAEIAEKVKLEPEEEEALAGASLTDVMALADILNTNPQNLLMEAYSDPLQYYQPDGPNETNPKVTDLLSSYISQLQITMSGGSSFLIGIVMAHKNLSFNSNNQIINHIIYSCSSLRMFLRDFPLMTST